MIAEIKSEKIGTIIVKDMSRLGRDYLKVGYYTEIAFPNAEVRFIAINNGVDSANQQDSDFTPFLNIINEWYAKDTSKKIREVFKAKGESGKPLCTTPPFGYKKDPDDKNHWIVDEDAAKVVKYIFQLCIEGYGPTQIAHKLKDEGIFTPSYYFKSIGLYPTAIITEETCKWSARTVANILDKQEYLGHIINFKIRRKPYKIKKKVDNDPSEWKIFKNKHEAIIGEEILTQFKELERKIHESKKELEQSMSRVSKIDLLIQRLYEDNVEGKISDKQFKKMTFAYENEQKTLNVRITELNKIIKNEQEKITNTSSFLNLVKCYTNIIKLDAEIIRTFIEKVYIYNVDTIGTKKIKIVFNFIGEIDLSTETSECVKNSV